MTHGDGAERNDRMPTRDTAARIGTRRVDVAAHRRQEKRRRRARRRTLLIVLSGSVLLLGCIGWIGVRGLIAKDALETAQTQVSAVQKTLTSGGTIDGVYDDLREQTELAVGMTSDPVWWLVEQIPVLGSNFSAVRQTAKVVDDVVVNAIGPFAAIPGLSVESLRPRDGVVDIAMIERLAPAMTAANDGLIAANADAQRIDTGSTLDAVTEAVTKVQVLLETSSALAASAVEIVPLLPAALGAEGARNYLLLFQNNAEERSTGGNPAALALITVDQGRIELGMQASSGDFGDDEGYLGAGKGYSVPVLPLDAETLHLYGDITSSFVQNITFTPDFPTVAQLARAMWQQEFPQAVDAVIALDPVALSELLKVSGGIPLSTGDQLTSDNAVEFLLSTVYAKYVDPAVQDQVFAEAARGAFSALTSGSGSMRSYFNALASIVEDERLMIWSTRSEEQDVVVTLPVSGTLPATNDPSTSIGVFFNDRSVSKMSYYLDAKIDVTSGECAPDGQLLTRTVVSITNTAPPDAADVLPSYVTGRGNGIDRGQVLDYIAVYGPVGATFGGMSFDDVPIEPTTVGTHLGRPVAILQTVTDPQVTHRLGVDMIGGTDASADVSVRHTPRVRPTPVTVSTLGC